MIEVTNAAIEVVEDAILIISANPTPFLGGFTGTTISHPGAAFAFAKVLDIDRTVHINDKYLSFFRPVGKSSPLLYIMF